MDGSSGLRERRLARVVGCEDARQVAQRVLPRLLFDYADGESTMRRHAEGFEAIRLRPRAGEWLPAPELRTTVLGTELSTPVLTAPCGGMRLVHPDGDMAVARAALRTGVAPVVPSGGGYSLEEVASVGGQQYACFFAAGWMPLRTAAKRRSSQVAGFRDAVGGV